MPKFVVTVVGRLVGEFHADFPESEILGRRHVEVPLEEVGASLAPLTADSKMTYDSIRGHIRKAGSTWVFETSADEKYIRRLPGFRPLEVPR